MVAKTHATAWGIFRVKNSTVLSLRRLAPVLAACVLVFGSRAAEVADASARRPAPAPRKAVPARKPAEPVRQPIPATEALGQVSGGELVNIRMGPGTQHATIAALNAGEFVKARAKQEGWVEIDWPSSIPAWVAKSDVRLTTRTGSEQMGVISDSSTRVYSQGNTKSQSLATLSKGAPVEILGEQGTWYKVKAPPTAVAYISAKFVTTGVSQPQTPVAPTAKVATPASTPITSPIPSPSSAPVRSLAATQIGSRKIETTQEVKRAIPMETPVAPPPISKVVLPAPTAPAAVSPEEPKAAVKLEEKKIVVATVDAPKKAIAPAKVSLTPDELAKMEELHEFANAPALEAEVLPPLDELMTTPTLNAILSEYEALPAPDDTAGIVKVDDPASELKEVLNSLRAESAAVKPVAEAKVIEPAKAIEASKPVEAAKVVEAAKPVEALKPVAEVQNDLAKVIEETRQSIKQDEPKRSVIDDNLQALERARVASEMRRKDQEDKQRASLSAALKQFEAMETRKRAEPDQDIDLGLDARTGVFMAPPEPAQPEKIAKLQVELQKAFEADQAKLSIERDQAVWTEAIHRAEEWRASDTQDIARRDSALLEAEENEQLARLLQEDAQRMVSETERAQDIQKQIEDLENRRNIAEALDSLRTTTGPDVQKNIEAVKDSAEQEILKTLETARKSVDTKRAETVLPEVQQETAKPKMEVPQSAAPIAPISSEEKYGFFVDPTEAPKAKKPTEELRSLMFPTEPAAGEPTSSKLPDIGRMPREEVAAPQAAVVANATDSAQTVELEAPAAQPVSAQALNFEEKGVEVIAEPDGSISEDQFRETNKRVKSKFVVPSNSPAPLGKRAEVINLD